MIQVENITKIYTLRKKRKVIALEDVTFNIKEGEIFGLLGTNGAGKTTILKILSTLLYPTKGKAFINGVDITKSTKEIRKKIGVVFGGKMIYHRITGRENLNFFGKVYNVPNLDKKVQQLMDFFSIADRIDDLVETYSTGMKAKLALMRALIHDPPIIYLDEPTLGLDVNTAVKLREKIKKLASSGKTVIFCSHYLYEVQEMCDRIAILDKGKLLSVDSTKGLKNKIAFQKKLQIELVLSEKINMIKDRFPVEISHEKINIPIKDTKDLHAKLKFLSENNIEIKNIRTNEPSLEEIFIEMTKKLA